MSSPPFQPSSSTNSKRYEHLKPRLVTLEPREPRIGRRRRKDAKPYREGIVRVRPAGKKPLKEVDQFDLIHAADDGTFLDPNLNLSFHGGAIITHVSLELIFWGNAWTWQQTTPTVSDVIGAAQALLAGPYMAYLDQYGIGSGGLRDNGITVLQDPPNPFSRDDWHNLIWDLIDQGTYPEPDEDGGRNLYMLILPPGVVYDDPNVGGIHGHPGDYDFPFDYDTAWAGFVLNDGDIDTITTRLSHELVEACTDPEDDGWTIDGRSSPDDEICDVCENITGILGSLMVQGYWSNRDRNCVIPGAAWASLGGQLRGGLCAAPNADGRVELFTVGFGDGAIYHLWQSQPGWPDINFCSWFSLGGVFLGGPRAVLNSNGLIEVFACGTDGAVYHILQTPTTDWGQAWNSLGGDLLHGFLVVPSFAVAANADGRLELFGRDSTGALSHTWQTSPGGGWSPWASLGGQVRDLLAIGRNADGRLEVFANGSDGALWHIWQTAPNNGWTARPLPSARPSGAVWLASATASCGAPLATAAFRRWITAAMAAPAAASRTIPAVAAGQRLRAAAASAPGGVTSTRRAVATSTS